VVSSRTLLALLLLPVDDLFRASACLEKRRQVMSAALMQKLLVESRVKQRYDEASQSMQRE